MRSYVSVIFFLFLLCLFIFINPGYSNAGINLPWSTTYDCNDWTTSDGRSEGDVNCNGLRAAGGWTCNGSEEQITSEANFPGGGGGKGQRHWIGDGINVNSGGIGISFTTTQSELWIRWYMRYQKGFKWASLNYDKILYTHTDGDPSQIIEFYGRDKFSFGSQAKSPAGKVHYVVCDNCGWATIMDGSTSDGNWHSYEIHMKMDTNGADGIGELWIDGILKIQKTDVNYGGTKGTTTGWTWVGIGSNQSNPDNGGCMYVDFDDIAVNNTGYIGPLGSSSISYSSNSSGSGSSAPPPPGKPWIIK